MLPIIVVSHSLTSRAHAESVLIPDEETLIRVPSASFTHELDRLRIPESPHRAMKSDDSSDGNEARAEQSDLLKTKAAQALDAEGKRALASRVANARALGAIADGSGTPEEFVDYIRGAIAWRAKKLDAARASWKTLLQRPAQDRPFKSTWAAYMLGRACATNEWEEAIARFQEVRRLAKEGLSDSLGLAAASYGNEARIHLQRREYSQALNLYLQQHTTGDESATASVEITLRKALTDGNPAKLRELAENPLWRQAVGGWLVANRENEAYGDDAGPFDRLQRLQRWIAAVETLKTNDVTTVEHIVLAAFQRGQQELSRQWIRRAPSAPICQWLTAKLWLRAGNVVKASQILERIQYAFPIEMDEETKNLPLTLEAGLRLDYRPAGQRIRGELGALRLARRDYIGSLDALLSGGYWGDAAYVAERVLTLDELRGYVDGQWPEPDELPADTIPRLKSRLESERAVLRGKLRALVGRRLVRSNQGHEAFDYLPESEHQNLFTLLNTMVQGADESRSSADRAENWWTAARLARQRGMELMGAELAPDWTITDGNHGNGITHEDRASTNNLAVASADELQRARRHGPICEDQFHYRYVAAAMAWRAAKMMPNNDVGTARILCTAGSWLKARDAGAADHFYKALVRRCRRTAIGEQADAMRWFPSLDAAGQPLPWEPPVKQPQPDADDASLVDGLMTPERSMNSADDAMDAEEPTAEEENDEVDEAAEEAPVQPSA